MKSEIRHRINQLNSGEVPDGYKKTEFGVFPCDWVTDRTFGDLFDFYSGLSKSRDELGEKGYAYLHYGDLHRGSFNTVSFEQYEQLPKCDVTLTGKETCLMEDGDVAFLDASEDLEGTSRAVLIDNPSNELFIAGLHIIYGKSKDDSLEKWYKQYLTSLESVKKQFQRLAAGFKVYGVNRDTLPKIHVAYPPSSQEQSRIAEILMKWDKAIGLYQQQIEKLNELKRSALANLFPQKGQTAPKYRFAGFTNPWEQRKLSDVVTEIKRTDENSGAPVMMITAENGFINQSERYSTNNAGQSLKKYILLEKGELAYNHGASKLRPYGSCFALTTEERARIPFVYHCFSTDTENPEFLSIVLNGKAVEKQLRRIVSSGARMDGLLNISFDEYTSIPILLSQRDEQNRIADCFRHLDHLITLHQRKVEIVAKQRDVLQQYLLGGIVRCI